jgi:HPt (histidine-containing phosphotransfer) domain-containing protein
VIACSQTDCSVVKRQAHSIKSSAAALGFVELSGIARELELRAESASPEQLREAAETLRGAFDKALGFAEAELAKKPGECNVRCIVPSREPRQPARKAGAAAPADRR